MKSQPGKWVEVLLHGRIPGLESTGVFKFIPMKLRHIGEVNIMGSLGKEVSNQLFDV